MCIFLSVQSCPLPDVPENGLRSQNTFNFGDDLAFACTHGFRLVGERVLACLANGLVSSTAPVCQNIDECITVGPCSPNGFCVDNVGAYSCYCHHGYTGSGFFCSGECVFCHTICIAHLFLQTRTFRFENRHFSELRKCFCSTSEGESNFKIHVTKVEATYLACSPSSHDIVHCPA